MAPFIAMPLSWMSLSLKDFVKGELPQNKGSKAFDLRSILHFATQCDERRAL